MTSLCIMQPEDGRMQVETCGCLISIQSYLPATVMLDGYTSLLIWFPTQQAATHQS